jgi:heptosyltransferase-2
MPGSKWVGKCWPAAKYLEVCLAAFQEKRIAVVLGSARDPGSQELVDLLSKAGVPHVSGVGKWDLVQGAGALSRADAYLGNDTGLAHLAEALGVPALVIYGPTTPEMGFGPWRERSAAVGLVDLGCRPCGKDGRRCYRPVKKYLCMNGLGADEVSDRFKRMGEKRP